MGQIISKIFPYCPKQAVENVADTIESVVDTQIENKITSKIGKEVLEDVVHVVKELAVDKVESYIPVKGV